MNYLSASSVEYLRAEVTASADPTPGAVQFSFTTSGDPTTWHTASWETTAEQVDGNYVATARLLVGPSFVVLPEGSVTVWVKTAASPEAVVKRAGTVKVS